MSIFIFLLKFIVIFKVLIRAFLSVDSEGSVLIIMFLINAMSRVCVYLLILMMFFSFSSYSQDSGSDQNMMMYLCETDHAFTDSDSGEALIEGSLKNDSEGRNDLIQSGFSICQHSSVKDPIGIQYTHKYSLINFPFFNFRINKNSVYHELSEFKSEQAKDLFVLAKNDQFNSDSLSRELNILYSKQAVYKNADKNLFGSRIVDLEHRVSELKKNAVQKAKHVLFLEQSIGESSNSILAANYDEVTPRYEKINKPQEAEKEVSVSAAEEVVEEVIAVSNDVSISELSLDQQADDEVERGRWDYEYCYQVAVFDKRPSSAFCKNMVFVKEEIVDGGKSFRYLTGSYRTYAKASSYRTRIKSVFPAAFIVVYKNGIRTSLKEAKEITDPVTSTSL